MLNLLICLTQLRQKLIYLVAIIAEATKFDDFLGSFPFFVGYNPSMR